MATTVMNIKVKVLGKKKVAAIEERARSLGVTPDRYVKQLVENDLALEHLARTKTFQEIMGPDANIEVDDDEFNALVEKVREKHYHQSHKR